MRTIKSQSGVAAVEMALLLGPLLLLAFGVTELGRAVYQYNTLAKAVRDGARYLSQYEPGNANRANEARSLVVCGATVCGDRKPLVSGMLPSYVKVHDRISDPLSYNLQSTTRGTVNLVRVEVTGFTFRSLMPGFVPNVQFAPIHTTMVQVL
ncbi:TadE/TadG family type IV pilus assembly protein [Massilia litorea]|uniref:Pilus assembly protein n=1 Tax=Massilia litorea TaxID=2769491 RepID=A0A7L9UA52_9BURK|nr:TadE family protein [Massilia litorea]QOL51767.1 pilus assembly protein [Massilia litorea]